MKIITAESLRGPRQPRIVADAPASACDAVSRRCACCGAVMPADVGRWIVAADDRGVMLLCSRECDAQMDTSLEDANELQGPR